LEMWKEDVRKTISEIQAGLRHQRPDWAGMISRVRDLNDEIRCVNITRFKEPCVLDGRELLTPSAVGEKLEELETALISRSVAESLERAETVLLVLNRAEELQSYL